MKSVKCIVSFCLMLCILLSLLPVGAFAEAQSLPENMQFTYVNPLYADTVTEWDLVQPGQPLLYADNTVDGKYYDAETAGKMIRDDLVARDPTISVNVSFAYNADTIEQDMQALVLDIMASAMEHTGNPVEGDYLLWQYTGFNVEFGNFTMSGQNVGATATFTMTYHADAAQEAAVDAAVAQLLSQLNVSGEDSYTKIKAIYDYITANITYDYDNLQNNSYKLKHTAYAALINKTAVCQGYAVLLYRLALELGVDCRMIPGNSDGQGHVWNIAKLDGKYYNLDSTWDAGLPIYQCFLVGSDNFDNHDRWDTPGQMPSKDNYNSAAFHAAYPMSKTDYAPATQQDWVASGTCGENLTWTLDDEGTLTISGIGTMKDFEEYSDTPWHESRDSIKTVLVQNDVTSVGNKAFWNCSNLTTVVLADGVTSVGEYAFYYCSNLAKTTIPSSLTSIGDFAFSNTSDGFNFYISDLAAWCQIDWGGVNAIPWSWHIYLNNEFLIDVVIPTNISSIAPYAFWDNASISSVMIPGNVISVNASAFESCSALTKVNIQEGVQKIESNAFSGCQALVEVVLPQSLVSIGNGAFNDCSFKNIEIPEKIVTIDQNTFCYCDDLTSIVLGKNVETISHNAFSYCSSLSSIYFTSDMPAISDSAFTGVTAKVYYPCDKDGWEPSKLLNYGGMLTWEKTHGDYISSTIAPTCTEKGYTTYTCACGDTYTADEVAAQGHSWDNGKVTKEPTEEETGIRTDTCTACGATRTEEIPKLEHTHQYQKVVTAPTCTETGYTTYTCACGDTYRADEVAALGHNDVTDEGYSATCTEEGLTDGKHCDRCDTVLIKQEVIAALGHSWDDGEITKEPTEEETGVRTYTCGTCGATRTETIPVLEHQHIYRTVITDPTCTEIGYTTYTCACGDTYTADEVAALGHNEVTDKGYAATCTEEGLTDGIHCDRCGVVLARQETIPAAGHNFENGVCGGCGAEAAVITTQPKTAYAKMGETAKATVKAEGDGLTYQWYIRNADKTKYSKSSVTGPTYACKMSEKSKDRRALCIIKDAYGNEVQSKTIVIREAASIVTEPKTTYAKSGATAKVTIEASGDGLKYQWYIKNAGSDKYSKSTVKTDTYTVKMSDKVNGRRIRCIVTDKYGKKVETKTVLLRMAATIITQPKDVTAAKGESVQVTVEAVGTDLTYQWYIKNAGKEKFVKSSVTSATYTVKMAKKVHGREIYCVVKDKYGKSVKSDIITLSMS